MKLFGFAKESSDSKAIASPARASGLEAALTRQATAEANLADLQRQRSALEADLAELEGKRATCAHDAAEFHANATERSRVAAELERVALLCEAAQREAVEAERAVKRARIVDADAAGEQRYTTLRSAAQAYLDAEAALQRATDAFAEAYDDAAEHNEDVEALAEAAGLLFSRVGPVYTMRDGWRTKVTLAEFVFDMRKVSEPNGSDFCWPRELRQLARRTTEGVPSEPDVDPYKAAQGGGVDELRRQLKQRRAEALAELGLASPAAARDSRSSSAT